MISNALNLLKYILKLEYISLVDKKASQTINSVFPEPIAPIIATRIINYLDLALEVIFSLKLILIVSLSNRLDIALTISVLLNRL